MRYSSSTSVTSSPEERKGGSSPSGPRLRKKHKRLDAICEEEYNRNHGDLNDSGGGAVVGKGTESADFEIRRSSRVRKAPVLLDVSPPPPKKRHKNKKDGCISSNEKNVRSTPRGVSAYSEELDTPGSWKSRLRSRGRSVRFEVKEELYTPRGKRKLFEDVDDDRAQENFSGKELGGEKGESEGGKYTVVKSKRPGRIKATNSSNNAEKDNDDGVVKDEVRREEAELVGNEEKEVELESDSDLGSVTEREKVVSDDATQLVETEGGLQMEDGCVFSDTKETLDNSSKMETLDNLEGIKHVEKQMEQLDLGQNQTDVVETAGRFANETDVAIEHLEKQAEQLDFGQNQSDVVEIVVSSANEMEGAGCSNGKDVKGTEHDEGSHAKENDVETKITKCAASDTPGKPRIKEGRRCGLCGGGTDGKPPKPLAQDMGESEHEVYSGSSTSEEPNYDVWDGFGDEPGWLGRLLGPINDRHGIAGIWVHQHCAVWSPEVYFAGLGCLKNVRAALCRGRVLKCTRCGRPGATIGCRVDRCPKTYHLPCARANGCIFDHRKFLIACTDHRHLFQPYGVQYFARIKKIKAKKMKLEIRKHANDACRKDIEAEEKWLENCGEDEEFLKRESKRLHRDLARIAPVYIGGGESESGKVFQGWESVAGLQDVIQCMKEVVILPLLYPEFFDNLGLTPPRGVLLHGYPGTGKTLVVRALIGACARGDKRIAYFARKGADCLGKYVGDAERQLRLLFQVAEKCQPSIIFFDEIDGLAPCRTRRQDQTHSSVVSTLLALLDGLKSRGSVVVIGATNRPDAVDPALRRPGRFDREIYFPLPSLKDRAAILSLHTQKWPKPVTGSLLQWIARKTAGFAGADLQALCTQAAITGLKRNFPLQEILSAAEKNSCSKRLPLPNFAVEERDWLEALSCSPPPCSRREAGMAANDVVSSPLPLHLIPCLLQPLAALLISLYLDERVWLPAPLSRAASMIKTVIVSNLAKKKLNSDCWWSFFDDFIRQTDVAKEIERNLLDSGILDGDADITTSSGFDDEIDDNNAISGSYVKHNGKTNTNLTRYTSCPSRNKSGFRMLIAGSAGSGQRHLASCLVRCFVGNVEIQKVDLATISQEGHGDVVQGITQILMKCVGVTSCMVFMPRIDLWAVETPQQAVEESDSFSTNLHHSEKDNVCIGHDHVLEKENISSPQTCKTAELAGDQGVAQKASSSWSLFVEHVESLHVSTSLMILATSEVPYLMLPAEIRQFFKKEISNCAQSTHMEQTVPRFAVQIDGNFDRDSVINLSAAKLSRDVVRQLIQFIHQSSHIHKTSSENRTFDMIEEQAGMLNLNTAHVSDDAPTRCNDESVVKAPLPPNNRTVKGRSNLHLAIASFGFQILRYPHFAELCWVTSKLKDGPSADVSGPWKGWPFNSCIVRPSNSEEKITVGSSSGNVKSKEKPGLVRGLIAVGLLAYRGVYTSLREVSFEVRKVFELLVGQINEKVQAGKDRYQYVRLLSQVAYLEDKVNSWAYTLQNLELDAPVIAANSQLNSAIAPVNQVQSEECEPHEENPQGFASKKVDSVDLNKEGGDFSCPSAEGRVATTDASLQNAVMLNSMPDKTVHNPEDSHQLLGKILNGQNGTHPEPPESENGRNNMLLDRDSRLLELPNGLACTDSAVISEDGLGSGESGDVKCSINSGVSSHVPDTPRETANVPRPDTDGNVQNVNFPSVKATKSEDVCLYRCCPECVNILLSLTKKILIHEWESDKSNWTVEDVHDVVASLSIDFLSAVRRVCVAENSSGNVFDGKPRKDEKLIECPELRTCNCSNSGNGIFVPMECSCHSVIRIMKADTFRDNQSIREMNFIFRDGVLFNMDPDKDASFHCKFETVCLCSLMESILMIKQSSD
ncbi:uncharacterized protein LOC21395390 [Morus notabilis]|uniref:uncharacterized protein LOC21395390 n=1 Tax=Morus notabilis TaxID=981085 RepID=UPI000CED5D0F|nr:uncharacterized protein LOC21395390 [Morus notabilis]